MGKKIDREKLLAERKTGLGSSDAAPVMGIGRRTALHVQAEKVQGIVNEDAIQLLELGLMMEPVILHLYEQRTGRKPHRVHEVIRSKEYPFLIAHLDAKIGRQALEVKNVTFPDPREWGEEGTDEVPEEYLIQTHHQMFVTETDYIEIPVLMFGKLRIYPIRRSERLINHLVATEKEFWERHIVKQEPVPPDFIHPATLPLVRRLYGVDEGKQIELGQEVLPLVGLYQELCRAESESSKRRDALKAELLTIMGDAAVAILPNGCELLRKKIHRNGFTVDETEYISFRVKAPCKELA